MLEFERAKLWFGVVEDPCRLLSFSLSGTFRDGSLPWRASSSANPCYGSRHFSKSQSKGMKTFLRFLVAALLCSACSYILPPRKVECCENKAACCHEQMCCLPRYAKAAGLEPKTFTPEVPVYSSTQDLEPSPGETLDKPGWFARLNPFKGSDKSASDKSESSSSSQSASSEKSSDDGFWGKLWPF